MRLLLLLLNKMKNNIKKLLGSFKRNGFKITINKILLKKFGVLFIKTQKKNKFIEKKFGNSIIDMQKSNRFQEQTNLITSLDISTRDLEKNVELLGDINNIVARIETINWLLPSFEHVLYGGIYTILRFAAYFQSKGIKNRIIIYNNAYFDVKNMKDSVAKHFPVLVNAE